MVSTPTKLWQWPPLPEAYLKGLAGLMATLQPLAEAVLQDILGGRPGLDVGTTDALSRMVTNLDHDLLELWAELDLRARH
jgi:hypothetical protein